MPFGAKDSRRVLLKGPLNMSVSQPCGQPVIIHPFKIASHSERLSFRNYFLFGMRSFGMAFHSEWLSIWNGYPFGIAFHSEWLRNNGGGWVGLGGWGPPRDRNPVEATKGRLESQVAERIWPEKISWVGGMRVAYRDFYR